MKQIDDDNPLTTLVQCWIKLNASSSPVSLDDLILNINELGEKIGYSTKTYNLLAIILILKNDEERALKIFESALNDLKIGE